MILPLFLMTLTLTTPVCLDANRQPLPVNNDQMLYWERHSPNQFLARGHLLGRIGNIYPDKNGHKHFQAVLEHGTVEVIYNLSFGPLPLVVTGKIVEACGDFITSTQPTSQYPASPDLGILHWVHLSNNPNNHPSGFLKIKE